MPITAKAYVRAADHYANGAVDWDTDTIKVMLLTNGYVPNQDTHDFRDDLGANEITGTGYSAGGATLANRTRLVDEATNEVRLKADPTSWATASFTAYYAVVYKSRGGAASADELISYVDFGGAETVSSATFTLTWDATNGVVKFTVS